MVNQEDCNVPLVRKFLEQANILIVICIQITVAAHATNALQSVNHNEFCVRMLCQKLLNLLFQPMLERVGNDCKMQCWRCIFRQVKEPCLDALKRIFETEIQDLALRCCKIPEKLPLRNA